MTHPIQHVPREVWALLEAVCEDRLTPRQAERLERLVLADESVRRLYVDYVTLHGNLHWDAALPAEPQLLPAQDWPSDRDSAGATGRRRLIAWTVTALAACLLVLAGAFAQRALFSAGDDPQEQVAGRGGADRNRPTERTGQTPRDLHPAGPIRAPRKREPIPGVGRPEQRRIAQRRVPQEAPRPKPAPFQVPAGGSSLGAVVAFIDARLEHQWRDEGVTPSPEASDYEWVRRAYLDLIGRIPTAVEVERFVRDDDAQKRRKLIDRLLETPRYVRYQATLWSNLLVGRRPNRDVNRPALEKFLRDSFARNRPWKQVVADFISAEGPVDENGAANFLVAHLNNQAVPATAVTARLFLGMQVQCTQCHNHPFNNWKQNQFWELNGFFKQTQMVRRKSRAGREAVLVNRKIGGPTFYPTRNELLRATYPKFGKTRLEGDPSINRRAELARLMLEDEDRQVARAFVNRTWARFFGYAFTRPLDDMGPHNPPSHPALLQRLTEEFVASGYDVKRLIRWICNSKAYRLTSRFNDTNREDDPAAGNLPLFSRMYVKAMSPEQLYDSLLVATKADRARGNWDDAERRRRQWLRQFFQAHQTEENDESTTFDGTIPQALLMMNSELVHRALSADPGTYFHQVLFASTAAPQKVRNLALAALSREPTAKEMAAIGRLLRRPAPRGVNPRTARAQVLQDVFWAYLNSNEFILIH